MQRRIAHLDDAVRRATGLSCSIGIAPNNLLAKIASELGKPDGLTLLTHADLPNRVWPLSVGRINGAGPKATFRPEGPGIRTIGELARTPVESLAQQFGKHYGHWLGEAANGLDERPLDTFGEPKSIRRETTFERDLDPRRDREDLTRILVSLERGSACGSGPPAGACRSRDKCSPRSGQKRCSLACR